MEQLSFTEGTISTGNRGERRSAFKSHRPFTTKQYILSMAIVPFLIDHISVLVAELSMQNHLLDI